MEKSPGEGGRVEEDDTPSLLILSLGGRETPRVDNNRRFDLTVRNLLPLMSLSLVNLLVATATICVLLYASLEKGRVIALGFAAYLRLCHFISSFLKQCFYISRVATSAFISF